MISFRMCLCVKAVGREGKATTGLSVRKACSAINTLYTPERISDIKSAWLFCQRSYMRNWKSEKWSFNAFFHLWNGKFYFQVKSNHKLNHHPKGQFRRINLNLDWSPSHLEAPSRRNLITKFMEFILFATPTTIQKNDATRKKGSRRDRKGDKARRKWSRIK